WNRAIRPPIRHPAQLQVLRDVVNRVRGVVSQRVALGIERPARAVFDVIDIVAEPAKSFQIVQDLPGDAGERHSSHDAQDDDVQPGLHLFTVMESWVWGPMGTRERKYRVGDDKRAAPPRNLEE